MRNVKVVVEYDGTDYFGFQYQPKVPTIQGELEKALSKIVKEEVSVYGSGRTDAGVHATGQVINFRTRGTIPIDRLCIAMNSLLPVSISAVAACEVDEDFHARYSARFRRYRYDILTRQNRSALCGRFCWHIAQQLDVDAMREAAAHLIGVHDFSSFACADRDDGSPIRNVTEIAVRKSGEHLYIDIRANAFLRSMVRVVVGTLVDVGLGRWPSSQIAEILNAADRRRAGKTAPARGLCLVEVEY